MMFVTVGTQLPFDRLIETVDQWARRNCRNDVFGQIGPTHYRPSYIQYTDFLDTEEFRAYIEQADIVVAHAGMGSIIMALELGKPILVMPRRADLGEHRNEHQMATAQRFLEQGRIHVAFSETELVEKLDQIESLEARVQLSPEASPELIATIKKYIHGEK